MDLAQFKISLAQFTVNLSHFKVNLALFGVDHCLEWIFGTLNASLALFRVDLGRITDNLLI